MSVSLHFIGQSRACPHSEGGETDHTSSWEERHRIYGHLETITVAVSLFFPFSLFYHRPLPPFNSDKHVWNYYYAPGTLLSAPAAPKGEETITHSQEEIYFLHKLSLKSHCLRSLAFNKYLDIADYMCRMLEGKPGSLRPRTYPQ